jgi:hypothetical protein
LRCHWKKGELRVATRVFNDHTKESWPSVFGIDQPAELGRRRLDDWLYGTWR